MLRKITLLFLIAGISSGFSQNLAFTSKADMGTARSGSSAATNGIFEFVANGFSAINGYTTTIEKYHFDTNTWSAFETSTPTIGKRYGNAEAVNGKLYLFNGKAMGSVNNNQLEIIDMTTGSLTLGAANPFPVAGAGSAVYENDIYFFGGNIGHSSYSKALYKYNTQTNTWTQLADMATAMEITGKIVSNKLYVFGGYNEDDNSIEYFETVSTTGNLALEGWMNVAESGTKLFQGKTFAGNKYAQITAFDNNTSTQEQTNIAWLVSPEYNKLSSTATSDTFLSYGTKDGYNNGATLQAYVITNWTGDIATSTKTLLPGTISYGSQSGFAENFVDSGAISLGVFPNTFRIAYKYTGGYATAATTTYQIDNVRIYSTFNSPKISRYDIATNSWSTLDTEMPQPVSANALAVSGTRIFVSGDYYEQSFLGVFDTADSSFAPMTVTDYLERRHHTADVYNNSLYVFGGNKSEGISTVISSTQAANLGTLSAGQFAENAVLKAYPNPVSDVLHFDNAVKNAVIYTIDGRKLEVHQQDATLDFSKLNSGIYLVVGEVNSKSFTTKVIKK